MYAGVVQPDSSPGNSAPQLIRFLAKANRTQYVYVAENSDPNTLGRQWWSAIPADVVSATKDYLAENQASPPAGSSTMVSLPYGTVEVKAGWRPLNPAELQSGRFHTQRVRFYEGSSTRPCYRDATWGLVALHIIQKTPSAPYFIYATFEQADNLLTADGEPVEDEAGNIIVQPEPATATSPQVCLVDPRPDSPGALETPSTSGMVILTDDPATCQPAQSAEYCGAPGSRLYYRNAAFSPPNNQPSGGNICVNKRDNAIPDYVIAANRQAHDAIRAYLQEAAAEHGIIVANAAGCNSIEVAEQTIGLLIAVARKARVELKQTARFPLPRDYLRGCDACCVIGGFVYRGGRIPDLVGAYLYADYCIGRIVAIRQEAGRVAERRDLGVTVDALSSFGEDTRGHLYAVSLEGPVYRLEPG